MVTQKFLLEGAVFALQKSGTLLRDAVTLYDQDAPPSEIVLAMFGREELGKYILLREAFLKVAGGGMVEFKMLLKECRDHETKQARAVLSVTQRFQNDGPTSQVFHAVMNTPPGSPEFAAAYTEMKTRAEQRTTELPDSRHGLRMSALYVGPKLDGSGWERPLDLEAGDAKAEVWDAVNDYSAAYDRLVRGNDDPNPFQTAFGSCTYRPLIPALVWPRVL